jgi:hypothetical protein
MIDAPADTRVEVQRVEAQRAVPEDPAVRADPPAESARSGAASTSSTGPAAGPTISAPRAAESVVADAPGDPTAPTSEVPDVPSASVSAAVDAAAVDTGESHDGPTPPAVSEEIDVLSSGESLLLHRDKVLGPALSELGRALKRQLRVEENELLDAVRNLGNGRGFVFPATAMADRLIDASMAPLHAAWLAGETFIGALLNETESGPASGGSDAEVREIATRLAEQVVDPIRRRIMTGPEGEGSELDPGAAIGAVFRDWRGGRVDGLAGDFALDAFGAGTLHASRTTDRALVWVADDGGATCPDCDDNALAGAIAAGEPFPTGHRHPPVHSGCRCILVPAAE